MSLKALNNEAINAAMNFGLLTDEQGALATSLIPTLAKLAPLLPYIAGVGAAIGAIAIGISAYKKAHPTLEMLQKDADAAKQEFDEMQSKVDETQKRIDELDELKKSGGLSSTEQAELDNLTSQNEQYERQLELLKQIAKYKQDTVDKKANNDAVSALNRFLMSDDRQLARQDPGRAQGMARVMLESHKNGLGGLLNAIDDYTAASEKLETANKALSDAELDKADEKTLDGLRDGIADAEKDLNKQREILATFQDFLVGIRGDLTDTDSIAKVDSLLGTIAATLGIKDSEKTFDNFKKGLKQIGDDADDVVNTFLKDGKLTEDQSRRLAQCLTEMGYSAEDAAIYFERMSRDMANATEQSTSAQINDLVSFRDELTVTSKALEDYKKALEGGEKGDAAAEMAKAYQSAVESYKAGKTDTYEMRAAADLFFSRDFLAQNNIGLDKVGELLSSGIWEAVFASDDYATNFVSYLQEHASELGDAVKVTADAAGNVQFAYKSVSALAEATNMSEASVIALLDALDVLGVQAMMSGEDMGELVDRLGLIPGETVKSAEGIQQIIQSLASDGLDYWDIQGALKSLESAGMIDTTGMQDLYQWINDATKGLDELDKKSSDVKVDADTSVAEKAVDGFKSRLEALLAGSPYEVDIVGNVTTNGELPGAVTTGSNAHSGSGYSGRSGHFAGGTTNAPRGKAYVNELGPETVIQDGVAKEFNDGKPALVDLKPGDIVLPADVTADAKRNGHKVKKFGSAAIGTGPSKSLVTIDGGRKQYPKHIRCPKCNTMNPETMANCVACGWNLSLPYPPIYTKQNRKKSKIKPIDTLQDVDIGSGLVDGPSYGGGSGSGGGSGGGSSDSDKKQKIDWIEVAIDRIERTISKFKKTIDSTFKSLGKRLSSSKDAISEITKEIELQKEAADRYLKEAESVGLSDDLAKLVREGTVDISEYDEETAKLINEYKQWYEKSLDCASAVDDLRESLGELYRENFDAVQEDFENKISQIEHDANMLNTEINKIEASGNLRSSTPYSSLADIESENISMLKSELAELQEYFDKAMESGEIEEGSKAWYEMRSEMDSVKEAIGESELQLVEFSKTIREIDWENFDHTIALIERTISSLKKTMDSTFKSLDSRLSASGNAALEITREIELQQEAADRYMREAESVGLSEDLAKLVKDGTINISEYDAETAKLINEYDLWYEKSLECASAVDDLRESLGELYRENFDAVQEDFGNKISQIEHEAKTLNTEMDKLEASGYLRSAMAYSSLSSIESQNISVLKTELAELQKYYESAMKSGEIEEGSKAWYEMQAEIDGVKDAISESELQLIEFSKTIREINWENFDYALDRISKLTDESEFLIGLLEDSNLINEDGSFTDEGIASVGLRLQNYNAYMAQADNYSKEIKKIERDIQSDPWNKDLIARREKLIDLQQQSITAAGKEKKAAADLAEQGINKQLESMRSLIDAYNESLDSAKDLYDYQKRVSKQTSAIADIQKQLAAYSNDTSQENRARVQKLQKQLKDAEESLQETEYEHYISEQKKLMEDLYSDYEETVNSRLDNIDAMIDDLIGVTNASSDNICQTIERIGASVGYMPTNEMLGVWDGSNGTFSIVSQYGGNIDTKLTSVGQTIDAILANVQAMVAASNIPVKQYKTGGLINYTGMAKVDGTPSKPELVLDASDTKNLLSAVNYLRSANLGGIDLTPTLSALKDNSFAFSHISSGINRQTSYGSVDNFEVNISIDHVDNYNDFIAQLQKDKNAERIIKAIAKDAMFGGSSMEKYKINVRS